MQIYQNVGNEEILCILFYSTLSCLSLYIVTTGITWFKEWKKYSLTHNMDKFEYGYDSTFVYKLKMEFWKTEKIH